MARDAPRTHVRFNDRRFPAPKLSSNVPRFSVVCVAPRRTRSRPPPPSRLFTVFVIIFLHLTRYGEFLCERGAGAGFGELAFLQPGKESQRSASVVANGDVARQLEIQKVARERARKARQASLRDDGDDSGSPFGMMASVGRSPTARSSIFGKSSRALPVGGANAAREGGHFSASPPGGGRLVDSDDDDDDLALAGQGGRRAFLANGASDGAAGADTPVPTIAVMVSEQLYVDHILSIHKRKMQIQSKVIFLQRLLLFAHWPIDDVVKLACALIARRAAKGSVLVRKGTKADLLYFVVAGELKLTRPLEVRAGGGGEEVFALRRDTVLSSQSDVTRTHSVSSPPSVLVRILGARAINHVGRCARCGCATLVARTASAIAIKPR